MIEFLIAWAVRGLRTWRRHRLVVRAQNWCRIAGRGESARAEATTRFSRPVWSAEIGYTYVLDGEYYSGFASLPAEDQKHAEGLALGWKDREVVVRYPLGKPSESTVLLEDQNRPPL